MEAVKIHKSCSTISVYSFYMTLINNDFRYLIKGYDDQEDNYVIYKQDVALASIFRSITREYETLIRDRKTLMKAKAFFEIKVLKAKYDLIARILNLYKEVEIIEVLGVLNEIDIPFFSDREVGPQIDMIINKSKGIKNMIKIKEINFNKRYDNDNENSEELISANIIKSLDQEALGLETFLELGYKVDIKETTMTRWINMKAMSEAKQQSING